jgi:thioredoxin reductase
MGERTQVAIIGAGPYGLSIAAHLRGGRREFRIFGSPMSTWCDHMPDGMLLKSDGFASNLSDPDGRFTLAEYCASQGIPYDDTRIPIALQTFRDYGRAFQRHIVPELENRQVVAVERAARGYLLHLDDGTSGQADHIVCAAGITHFACVPPELSGLPADLLTHSSAHRDVRRFAGRSVTVLGGGASAIDLAVLLADAGVDVTLVARRSSLRFADPPAAGAPSWRQNLREPRSVIGPGWRSRIYAEVPWAVRLLPPALRLPLIKKHLGPAAGWPMKARFADRVRSFLGHEVLEARDAGSRVHLRLGSAAGSLDHRTDHVIAATGYKVDIDRIPFLSEDLKSRIRSTQNAPVLSRRMESTLPGLYFVGAASVSSFGPVMRFACGADWAAQRIARNFHASRFSAAQDLSHSRVEEREGVPAELQPEQ